MPTGFASWSQIAALNASADSSINWAEGQAPSSVNDSARAMMASLAKWRDDTGGNLSTAGTSTAYTITSNSAFASKALMNAQEISFLAHATNGGNPTLNVDGLGASAIVIDATAAAPPAGTLIAGGVYTATYYIVPDQWRLKNFYQLPFVVPVGGLVPYTAPTPPSSNFILPYGQAISRTTYSTYFSLVGTTYGSGDGSTTFNVPDLRGRFIAGKDDMGGSAASRLTSTYFGTSAAALGAIGGAQNHTLTLGELPTGIASSGTNSISVTSINSNNVQGTLTSSPNTGGVLLQLLTGGTGTVVSTGSNSIGVTSNNTSGSAHATVPPALVLNYLLRII
ncbi:tail fiber protein [Bradyrhizobium betae]|uniref:Phage tail protein n=1 Tax=Bradyrhizobium betae TaxID=244734 RepID=A0A4Q1VB42_9BRAD|nr:tail fiber protein [Bradyrhizobium betae]RXT48752.1 phage tail protein [Bradyrhizobium betae]